MFDHPATIPDGRYYIVCSRIPQFYGALSLQYKGRDAPVVLIPFGSEPGTLWNITTHHDGTRIISPDGHPHFQAASVGGVVRTLGSTKQTWAIEMADGTCTIFNRDHGARWEVQLVEDAPVPGGRVTVKHPSKDKTSHLWWCLPVPTC